MRTNTPTYGWPTSREVDGKWMPVCADCGEVIESSDNDRETTLPWGSIGTVHVHKTCPEDVTCFVCKEPMHDGRDVIRTPNGRLKVHRDPCSWHCDRGPCSNQLGHLGICLM